MGNWIPKTWSWDYWRRREREWTREGTTAACQRGKRCQASRISYWVHSEIQSNRSDNRVQGSDGGPTASRYTVLLSSLVAIGDWKDQPLEYRKGDCIPPSWNPWQKCGIHATVSIESYLLNFFFTYSYSAHWGVFFHANVISISIRCPLWAFQTWIPANFMKAALLMNNFLTDSVEIRSTTTKPWDWIDCAGLGFHTLSNSYASCRAQKAH